MTVDFNKAAYKAFKLNFQNIRMVPCFFHLFQRLYLKLPQLKDKNKTIKNKSKDLICNLKLLCFIDNNKIDTFFEKIEINLKKINPKFFRYFKKNYLINLPFSDKEWNYDTLYNNDNNKDLYFSQIIFVKVLIVYLIYILFRIGNHFIPLENVF